VLSTRHAPKSSLSFNSIYDDIWQGGDFSKDSRIALQPNLPSCKHDEGYERLCFDAIGVDETKPPIFDRVHSFPRRGVDDIDSKPSKKGIPNSQGVATLEKNVCRGFLLPPTQLANITICPPSLL
jgi:hypothetical protein